MLKVFPYTNKAEGKGKEELRALDALSVLETMQELEDYHGVTKDKLQDSWYDLKVQLRNAIVSEMPKEEGKAPESKKES